MSTPAKFYRLADITQLTGLSKSVIKSQVREGRFPQPFKLSDGGRAVAWMEDDLAAWQASRIATRGSRYRRVRLRKPEAA